MIKYEIENSYYENMEEGRTNLAVARILTNAVNEVTSFSAMQDLLTMAAEHEAKAEKAYANAIGFASI